MLYSVFGPTARRYKGRIQKVKLNLGPLDKISKIENGISQC
jgi:hypothetical protein